MKTIKCLSMNCQGISSKLPEIKLICEEQSVDVLLLQESWLTNSHTSAELKIDGYNEFRTDRAPKQWGTLSYFKDCYKVLRLFEEIVIPCDVFKVVTKKNPAFIIVNVYRTMLLKPIMAK